MSLSWNDVQLLAPCRVSVVPPEGARVTVSSFGNRKRSRKKGGILAAKEKAVGIDLESSGEFASVEKMLATTDANKFSPFLQGGAAELEAKGGESARPPTRRK